MKYFNGTVEHVIYNFTHAAHFQPGLVNIYSRGGYQYCTDVLEMKFVLVHFPRRDYKYGQVGKVPCKR